MARKNLLPLHPQHRNMDKDRFILVHAEKWGRDLRLGSFNERQRTTMAAMRYEGWSLIGTDVRRLPVIESTEGTQYAVDDKGAMDFPRTPLTRWDGETDRERKLRRARELTGAEVKVIASGGSELFATRTQVKDQIDVLEWEFMRNPDVELANALVELRARMNVLDKHVIAARLVASLKMPTFDEDENEEA